MRSAIPCILLLIIVAACGGKAPPPNAQRSQEELARLVFTALKAGDFGTQTEALPVADDFAWTLEMVAKNAPDEAERAQERMLKAGGSESIAERNRAGAEQSFTRAFELSSKELDWKTATFRGVDLERTKSQERYGFQSADIWFSVAAGDETHEFLLSKCLETPRGWVAAGGVHFHPKAPEALMDTKLRMLRLHMRSIEQAVRLHQLLHHSLPASLGDLTEVDSHSGQPLLKTEPVDPWGNALVYEKLEEKEFRLISGGPDGTTGTEDDIVYEKPAAADEAAEDAAEDAPDEAADGED